MQNILTFDIKFVEYKKEMLNLWIVISCKYNKFLVYNFFCRTNQVLHFKIIWLEQDIIISESFTLKFTVLAIICESDIMLILN